jgi:hypothetical protein
LLTSLVKLEVNIDCMVSTAGNKLPASYEDIALAVF